MSKKGKGAHKAEAYADKMDKKMDQRAATEEPEADKVKKLIKEMPKSVKEGSEWYIVSMKWINKWQNYVGFNQEESTKGDHPGQIDNSDIVLHHYAKLETSTYLKEIGNKDMWMNY